MTAVPLRPPVVRAPGPAGTGVAGAAPLMPGRVLSLPGCTVGLVLAPGQCSTCLSRSSPHGFTKPEHTGSELLRGCGYL